jgi:hypothetical protein
MDTILVMLLHWLGTMADKKNLQQEEKLIEGIPGTA